MMRQMKQKKMKRNVKKTSLLRKVKMKKNSANRKKWRRMEALNRSDDN